MNDYEARREQEKKTVQEAQTQMDTLAQAIIDSGEIRDGWQVKAVDYELIGRAETLITDGGDRTISISRNPIDPRQSDTLLIGSYRSRELNNYYLTGAASPHCTCTLSKRDAKNIARVIARKIIPEITFQAADARRRLMERQEYSGDVTAIFDRLIAATGGRLCDPSPAWHNRPELPTQIKIGKTLDHQLPPGVPQKAGAIDGIIKRGGVDLELGDLPVDLAEKILRLVLEEAPNRAK